MAATSGSSWFAAAAGQEWPLVRGDLADLLIGCIGLIPVCGVLIGLQASASLRILLLLFAPLSQFCATMFSVRRPEIAAELRAGRRGAVTAAARGKCSAARIDRGRLWRALVVLFGQRILALVDLWTGL